MKKKTQEHILIDDLTKQLMLLLTAKLTEQNGKKISKAEVYREAVYQLAKKELTEHEIDTAYKIAIKAEMNRQKI